MLTVRKAETADLDRIMQIHGIAQNGFPVVQAVTERRI